MRIWIIAMTAMALSACSSSVFKPPAAGMGTPFCDGTNREYVLQCEQRGAKQHCDCVPVWAVSGYDSDGDGSL